MAEVATSLRALLAHSIDYAGMFPPCQLELEPALKNQAQYLRSTDAWMLSAFVLPVEQFGAAKQLLTDLIRFTRCKFPRSGQKLKTQLIFVRRWRRPMRRFVRCPCTMLILCRSTSSKCFCLTMSIRSC